MKTVLMLSPNDLDGVSYYRHWGPMLELERLGHVRLIAMPQDSKQLTNWQYYLKCDFAFISRPATNREFYFIKECEKHGLPVWVDIDDNIFCIPDDNESSHAYYNEEAQKFTLFGLKSASVVTVATKRLNKFLKNKFAVESLVIPNAIPDLQWERRNKFNRSTSNVMWRGSRSHIADLLYFEQDIIKLIKSNELNEFKFFGLNPYFISRKIKTKNVSYEPAINHIDYLIKIKEYAPKFTFVCMIDSEFNQTRSHNAWLEATMAGSILIAPDWESWAEPGIINYSDFSVRMNKIMQLQDNELSDIYEASVINITQNYILSRVNQLRLEIINNLNKY